MFLTELFTEKYPWKYTHRSNTMHKAEFTAHDGSHVVVSFIIGYENDGKRELTFSDIMFDRNLSTHATGAGDAIKIFSTVIDITYDFIFRVRPDVITFGAAKSEMSRVKLYSRFANQLGGSFRQQYQKVDNLNNIEDENLKEAIKNWIDSGDSSGFEIAIFVSNFLL